MGKDQAARFHGNIDELKIKLSQYEEDCNNYFSLKFSKYFTNEEVDFFVRKM